LTSGSRSRLLFTLLYFSEGVPIGFLWWSLPAVLREQGSGVDAITTLTAALALPWTFKFLAGPVVDRSAARGVPLKAWILVCQLAMGLTLLPLAARDPAAAAGPLFGLLIVHACFAAVQDVAIDALCIRTVPESHLGQINGWMQFGMTAGRAAAAACVPLLVASAGWSGAIWLVVALVWLPMLAVVGLVREREIPATAIAPQKFRVGQLLGGALLPAMIIALLAGGGFEATGALAGPLLVDLGASPLARSVFFGGVAPAGLALGGLLAARVSDRLGLPSSLAIAIAATAIAVGATSAVLGTATADGGGATVVVALGAVYLGAGFLISTSYACFMDVARGRWAATRFSFLMAVTNACESGSAYVGGRLAAPFGYPLALIALAVASLFSLPFVGRMRLGEAGENGED
jgi:PAT family beta-lactamase induction signal transducer AmpG